MEKCEHSFFLSFTDGHPVMIESSLRDAYRWYPMYVSYRRELLVKKALDDQQVRNFLPMVETFERKDKKVVRRLLPAIHNLLFVYATRNMIRYLKMFNPACAPLQYMSIKPRTADQVPVVISVDEQRMEQFMKAMEVRDGQNRRTLLPYDEALYGKEGRKIKFIKGDFEGIEGTIKRIKNNRSLIITLKHVGVLVITIDHATDIEFID